MQATNENIIGTRARKATKRSSETLLSQTDGQSNKKVMSQAALASYTPIATIGDPTRAGPPKVLKGDAGHAVSSQALTSPVSGIIPRALICSGSSPNGREGLLRWKSSPFTLRPVGDQLYCPRLEVDQTSQVSRVLPSASYPLDTAAMKIHEYGGSGKPLPCDAIRILIIYDEIQRLGSSDTRITHLDPTLFGPSCRHSLEEQSAFQKWLRGWINYLGHRIEFPDVFRGSWDFKSLRVDYTRFRISLCLSRDNHQIIYILPSNLPAPKRTEPLQVSSN